MPADPAPRRPRAAAPDRQGAGSRPLPAGRHGLPRAFVVSDQRARIIDAAGEAFAANGYAGTRVSDITSGAKVSRTTFYEHFADKEACFVATYDEVSEILLSRVAEQEMSAERWEDRLRLGLRAFLTILQAEPSFARMCIVEVVAAGPMALERRDTVMKRFGTLLCLGRSDGSAQPGLAEEFAVGGLYELVYARILRGETDQLTALEDELVTLGLTLLPRR
jgi:AcrR family transcriptional regulator